MIAWSRATLGKDGQSTICSFCEATILWRKYPAHLDKWHRHGAVRPIQHTYTNLEALLMDSEGELELLPPGANPE
jgi:hypothetical protein